MRIKAFFCAYYRIKDQFCLMILWIIHKWHSQQRHVFNDYNLFSLSKPNPNLEVTMRRMQKHDCKMTNSCQQHFHPDAANHKYLPLLVVMVPWLLSWKIKMDQVLVQTILSSVPQNLFKYLAGSFFVPGVWSSKWPRDRMIAC
jgi:hypothetical protein